MNYTNADILLLRRLIVHPYFYGFLRYTHQTDYFP